MPQNYIEKLNRQVWFQDPLLRLTNDPPLEN